MAAQEAFEAMPEQKITVYHDGACPLCAAEIALYRRTRGAEDLNFVDVANAESGDVLGSDLRRADALARFHVRDEHGTLLSGASAFSALWRALPGWRWLGMAIGTRWLLPAAEIAYRAFLPLRPYIARGLRARRR